MSDQRFSGSATELFAIYAVGMAITAVVCIGAGQYGLAALAGFTSLLAMYLVRRRWKRR